MLTFLKSLGSAVVGGAVASAAQVAVTGETDPGKLKTAAVSGALLVLAAYLKQSPVTPK